MADFYARRDDHSANGDCIGSEGWSAAEIDITDPSEASAWIAETVQVDRENTTPDDNIHYSFYIFFDGNRELATDVVYWP